MTTFTEAVELLETIDAAWIAGYETGYAHGVNARHTEAEALARHTEAARIVTALASVPPRDRDADRAAAARREARWSA